MFFEESLDQFLLGFEMGKSGSGSRFWFAFEGPPDSYVLSCLDGEEHILKTGFRFFQKTHDFHPLKPKISGF